MSGQEIQYQRESKKRFRSIDGIKILSGGNQTVELHNNLATGIPEYHGSVKIATVNIYVGSEPDLVGHFDKLQFFRYTVIVRYNSVGNAFLDIVQSNMQLNQASLIIPLLSMPIITFSVNVGAFRVNINCLLITYNTESTVDINWENI